jgi:thioredoxin-related protein
MMIKRFITSVLVVLLLWNAKILFSQEIIPPSDVKWYTIEEADSLFEIQKKPLFIDVYTEWCGWCKHMMKTTFAHKGIASYMNQNFINVRFDAETFDTLTFQNKTYTNPGVGRKPKHDLAKFLLNGRYSFPTIVYMGRDKKFYPIPGYQKVAEIEPFLIYFAENLYSSINLQDFDRYFKCTYKKNFEEKEINAIPDSMRPDTTGKIKWYSFAEAEKLSKESNKLIFLSTYTNWCQSCRVADSTNYKSKVIADIMNKHFIPVKFDAASAESYTFFGKTYKPGAQFAPHELTRAYMRQSFQMPALLFINNKGQQITELHGFVPPSTLEGILSYFANGTYATKKFDEFRKSFKNKIKY